MNGQQISKETQPQGDTNKIKEIFIFNQAGRGDQSDSSQ